MNWGFPATAASKSDSLAGQSTSVSLRALGCPLSSTATVTSAEAIVVILGVGRRPLKGSLSACLLRRISSA
jgi:hypothetical protein